MSNLQTILDLSSGRQHARLLRLSFPHEDAPVARLLVNRLKAAGIVHINIGTAKIAGA